MNCRFCAVLLALLGLSLAGTPALAQAILAPGDSILAIDLDPVISRSDYPGGEPPSGAVDDTLAKYLNFAGPFSGFIVTPQIPAQSIAKSIRLTTANDAEGRDPTSFEVWGTNDAITSLDNSTGLAENWTLIGSDAVTLPAARDTVGDLVPFANTDLYTSYKILFPTLKGSSLFQIAEVELFGDVPDFGVTDFDLLTPGSGGVLPLTLAVQIGPDSEFPGAESPSKVIDGDAGTKYLNFGKENSGFIVTPASGPDVVKTFRITTANDSESRDPTSWELYGTDEAISSVENSQGNGESWTLVDSGMVDLPLDRTTPGPFVAVNSDTPYSSYRMVFPTIRDTNADDADSLQIAEIQFYNVAVPEPTCVALCGLALACGIAVARRRR
jgi:hypothetical protein